MKEGMDKFGEDVYTEPSNVDIHTLDNLLPLAAYGRDLGRAARP